MKKYITIAMLFSLAIEGHGQDLSFYDRLYADKISNNSIFLFSENLTDKAQYKYLTSESQRKSQAEFLKSGDKFSFSGKNRFVLYVGYFNPLKYKVETSTSYSDNPNVKTFDEFFKTFSTTFEGTITPTQVQLSEKKLSDSESAKIKINELRPLNNFLFNALTNELYNPTTKELKKVSKTRTILLKDWLLEVYKADEYTENLDEEVSKLIEPIEEFIYFKIKYENESSGFDQLIKTASESIYNNSNTYQQFDKEVAKCEKLNKALTEKLKESKEKLKDLIRKIKDLNTKDDNLKNYNTNTASWLELTANELIASKEKKLNEFDKYVNLLIQERTKMKKNKTTIDSLDFIQIIESEMVQDKDLNISFQVSPVSADGKVGDKEKIDFSIIRNETHSFLSTGMAVLINNSGNGLTYNNFTTAKVTGGYSIVNNKQQYYVLPVLFINWAYRGKPKSKMKSSTDLIFIPQLGITVGKEFPTVLGGVGVLVAQRLSIHLGGAIGYTKDLKDPNDKDVILTSESDLEGKLTQKVTGAFYFSVAFRINKK
jgi:hypothetical protein